MPANLLIILAVFIAVFGLVYLLSRRAKKEGQLETELTAARERADDVLRAKNIRDTINANPDRAKRVRDEFTRD